MKVNVEFDTKEKNIVAKIDGQEVKNLSSIMFYTYDGKASFELSTVVQDEDNKMVSVNRIYAEDRDELIIKPKFDDEPIHKLIARELFGVK
jgi:hypothetical protein